MIVKNKLNNNLVCAHCGENCPDESYKIGKKSFCCAGCKTVYELLNENNLSNYYTLMDTPGVSLKEFSAKKFDFLDDKDVVNKLLDFKDDKLSVVSFDIPQIHCSSCIWLLENLYKLNPSINSSRVNFLKKNVEIHFSHKKISLRQVVELLSSIGYEPSIQLDSAGGLKNTVGKSLYYKIGIAAFCFGNIMLLSFPEYLGIGAQDFFYIKVFGYLNLALSLPVFLYSASDYFVSAFKGLRKKIINIDVPIALGILILFIRSSYEILTHNGSGYFDSLTGLVFFLLIGKLLQEKTYSFLNFERNYKSYFPLAVHVKKDKEEISIPVSKLKIGDRIIIRKNEIIPADAILFKGDGSIDYSFVTGESKPVQKVLGELIYAGGRQLDSLIELEVIKEVSQSYLTQLWNNDSFLKKAEGNFTNFSNNVSKYFTLIILLIAAASSGYWFQFDAAIAFNVLTSVLIVACPCALALSVPFTFGNSMRIFGRNKFYLKNSSVIEEISKIDSIVFDKTGTLTKSGASHVTFAGPLLNPFQQEMIKSVVRNSTHPLSKAIYDFLQVKKYYEVKGFEEFSGKGISGEIFNNSIRLGSLSFLRESIESDFTGDEDDELSSQVYLAINFQIIGYFNITNAYREGIGKVTSSLNKNYELTVLSGDNESEREYLQSLIKNEKNIHFFQSPGEKLNFIKNYQADNKRVLMFGDGLNDAGALAQSEVGIAVTENISYFSPACDAILDAAVFSKIPAFINFSKISVKIIYISFIISFLYNLVGLSFAIEGMLSPIVAAILMPLSSISVVFFATVSTNFMAKRKGL